MGGVAMNPLVRFLSRRSVRACLLVLVALALTGTGDLLAKRKKRGRRQSSGIIREIGPRGKRADGRGRKSKKRPTLGSLQGSTAPRLQVLADPLEVAPGDPVKVTIRMMEGQGNARHVAFHVGTDPSVLRYSGYTVSGRGALMVQQSEENPGEIIVYRSSLPEGFNPAEPVVELQFETLGRGDSSISLTEIRLMDRRARDMDVTYEAGDLYIR